MQLRWKASLRRFIKHESPIHQARIADSSSSTRRFIKAIAALLPGRTEFGYLPENTQAVFERVRAMQDEAIEHYLGGGSRTETNT